MILRVFINQDIPLPYQLYLKALWKHSCDTLLQTDRQWCWLFLASFLDLSKACDECAFECSTNDRRASRGRNWSEYTEEVHSILQEVRYASHDEEDLWSCKKNRITLYLWTCVSFAVNVAHDSRQRPLRSWRTDMCWWGMELVNMKEKQAKKSLYPSQSGIDFCLKRKNTVCQALPDFPDYSWFFLILSNSWFFPEFHVKTPDNSWFSAFYP